MQLTVKPNKPKYQSLEQRRIYCRAKLGEQVTHAQKTPGPSGFQGRGFGSFFKCFFFFFFNVDDFLAARHVGSQLPDQGLNPHPLHCKGES